MPLPWVDVCAGPLDPLCQAAGGVAGSGDRDVAWPSTAWAKGYLFSRALTIGGGTSEVQRNIIAERVLGLPHDVDAEGDRSWAESHGARRA